MAALFRRLHPDLQKTVQLLPAFAAVLRSVAGNELTPSKLIDAFFHEYNKKDLNIISRLKWWGQHFGHSKVNEISKDHVRHGINTLLAIGTTGKSQYHPNDQSF